MIYLSIEGDLSMVNQQPQGSIKILYITNNERFNQIRSTYYNIQATTNNNRDGNNKNCSLDHHQWSFAPDCWGFGPSFHQAANTWKKRSGASALPLTEHQTSPRTWQIPRTLPETSFVQGFRNILFPPIYEWQWTSAFNVFILFHIDCFRPCTWCWMRMMWLGRLVEHRQDSP